MADSKKLVECQELTRDVAALQLSEYRVVLTVVPGTLSGEPDCADQQADLPIRFHILATVIPSTPAAARRCNALKLSGSGSTVNSNMVAQSRRALPLPSFRQSFPFLFGWFIGRMAWSTPPGCARQDASLTLGTRSESAPSRRFNAKPVTRFQI